MDATKMLKLEKSLEAVIKAKLKWEEKMESHRQLMRSMNLLKPQHVATVDDHHPHPTTTFKADLEHTNSNLVDEKLYQCKRVFYSDDEGSDCGGVQKRQKLQTKEGTVRRDKSMTQCQTILRKLMNHEQGYHVSANPSLKIYIICQIHIMS